LRLRSSFHRMPGPVAIACPTIFISLAWPGWKALPARLVAEGFLPRDAVLSGLTLSDPPTQAGVQELRHKTEELADDVRALATLVHALRTALVGEGLTRGGV